MPLALLLMALLELSRFSIYALHGLGIILVVARLLHGYALSFADHFRFGRVAGATLTFLVLLIEAILCLYQAYRAHGAWFYTG
nr:MAPEG family [uncultured bacterium]